MGNTCIPVADYVKFKNKIKFKIFKKKKKTHTKKRRSWCHHFMANRQGNNANSETLFSWAPKSLQMVTVTMKLKDACSLEEQL